MPFLSNIDIHVADLKKIVEVLEEKRIAPSNVKIVDDGHTFVIRDSGGFLISYVPKKIIEEHG